MAEERLFARSHCHRNGFGPSRCPRPRWKRWGGHTVQMRGRGEQDSAVVRCISLSLFSLVVLREARSAYFWLIARLAFAKQHSAAQRSTAQHSTAQYIIRFSIPPKKQSWGSERCRFQRLCAEGKNKKTLAFHHLSKLADTGILQGDSDTDGNPLILPAACSAYRGYLC
ncbi:hypothetical protein BCV70DRAFT_89478 [Testicularia cyperi]|uniref:Uncharacterized protein n=1 Tax=Testicularia cyperi TaxID=1882483 RepID=A0A317XUV1_9BASI|nr:hypothetical protein BCV70DRAFT_89478 [Testicularia cyperi]